MKKKYKMLVMEVYLYESGNMISCSSTDDIGMWKPGWNA